MEIKKLISNIFSIVLIGILFIFCIFAFINVENSDGEKGVFNIIGTTSVSTEFEAADTDAQVTMAEVQNTEPPEVAYVGGTYKTGIEYDVKSLIKVKPVGSDVWYNGTEETGFTVTITDILDDNGISLGTTMESADASEEVTAPAEFDDAAGTVKFNQSGVYRISVKVAGENGRYAIAHIRVPVEL